MKKIIILLALTILVLTSSCRKVVEFNGSQTDALPVLICQATTDSPVALRLSYSNFFLREAQFPVIDNATIRADLNGTPNAATFSYTENGIYLSDLTLRPDDTLTLRVSVPDHGELTAGCRMPAPPSASDPSILSDFTIDTFPSYSNYSDTLITIREYSLDFRFTLNDPANVDNYYQLKAFFLDPTDNQKRYLSLIIDDDVLFEQDPTGDYFDLNMQVAYNRGSQVLFSGDRINGLSHVIRGEIEDVRNPILHRGTKLYLEVTSLSRDAYLFQVTLINQRQNGGALSIVNEPVQVHSNVNGGIGILGASSSMLVEIPLGQ